MGFREVILSILARRLSIEQFYLNEIVYCGTGLYIDVSCVYCNFINVRNFEKKLMFIIILSWRD